jgi:hypothetical protein
MKTVPYTVFLSTIRLVYGRYLSNDSHFLEISVKNQLS